MNRKIALLFAGQGAQTVGMGQDLAAEFPEAADLFRRADEVLGRKLSEIVWKGPLGGAHPNGELPAGALRARARLSRGLTQVGRSFSGDRGGRLVVRRVDGARRGGHFFV